MTVRLWDVQSGRCLATMTEHTNWVHQALFLDEQIVVSAAEDGKVCCWDIATGVVELLATNKQAWLMGIAIADDRQTIAVGYSNSTIEIWDWHTRTCRTLESHGNRIKLMSFSPDAEHLVTLSDDGLMGVCNYHQYTCDRHWSIGSHDWSVLKFLPNHNRRVAIGGRAGIEIWDIIMGEPVQWLRGHTAPVWGISFTSCGKYLISSGEDGTIKLWDLAQGTIVHNIINTDPFDYLRYAPRTNAILLRATDCFKSILQGFGKVWFPPVGAIHEAAVLFGGSLRIKKPTRHCPYWWKPHLSN